MRTFLTVLSIVVILGLAVGMSIPIAHAQDETTPSLTFHVLPNGTGNGSQDLETIPPDAQDIIIITGSNTVGAVRAALQNLCNVEETPTGTPSPTPSPTATGTVTPPAPCEAVDIYYQLEFTLSWDSGLRDDCSIWGVCARDVSPLLSITYGGSGNEITEAWGHCGTAAQATGSCTNTLGGMIPAEDIDNIDIGGGVILNEFFHITHSGEYGGTTWLANYSIMLSTAPIVQDCAGQFNIGGVLGSMTLAGNNSAGVNMRTSLGMNYPAPGQWYALQVSGAWKNNGSGPDLRTIAERTGALLWFPLVTSSNVECSDTVNDTYYLQMTSAGSVYFRVNDTDGNWSNTGSLTVTVSSVTAYTPYPNGCELQYQVGSLLQQGNVDASLEDGLPLEGTKTPGSGGTGNTPQPTRYYMLETIGGPADIGFLTWALDIGIRGNATDLLGRLTVPDNWYDMKTAPFITCLSILDPVEHVRVFFPADSQAEAHGVITHYYHSIRVRDVDGNYSGNSGTIGFRLYEATNMQMTTPGEVPGPDGCAQYAHTGTTPVSSVVIQAVANKGSSLPNLTDKSIYALEVTDGPWLEAGSTDSYSVEISDDNGDTWTDLESYPNLLCAASQDGEHIEIYVYGASGKHWKARVNDTDTNFTTNTGNIGMDVFAGYTLIDEWADCARDYSFTQVPLSEEQRKIPANQEEGKAIVFSSLAASSSIYALEITDEAKWYEAGAERTGGSYLVDISDDNGTTWVALEDSVTLCKQQLGDGDRWEVVIDVGVSGGVGPDPGQPNNRKLRVRDGDGDFLGNSGYVMYKLYNAVAITDTTNIIDTTPPEWVVACNESYSRPGGFISWNSIGVIGGVNISIPVPMVGEWINYLRNSITYYLAWCPQHTALLKSIGSAVMDKEPMASVQTLIDFMKSIQTMLATSQAAGGTQADIFTSQEPDLFSDSSRVGLGAGGTTELDPLLSHGGGAWDLFLVGNLNPATNFWNTGQIDLSSAATPLDLSNDVYVQACIVRFDSIFGTFSSPFCKFIGFMRENQVIRWIALVIDILVAISFLLKYLPGWVSRFIGAFKGLVNVLGKQG